MGAKVSNLAHALYDPKKRQFLGRDGAAWGKLGVFYFFFYLGLAGFFCAMLAIFMALSPRDHPRYVSQESRMRTRSNPLTPGLGFRPQPDIDRNLIIVQKTDGKSALNNENPFAKSLQQYLDVFYSQEDKTQKKDSNEDNEEQTVTKPKINPNNKSPKFQINNPGPCQKGQNYGYSAGTPCVLIKMNKIIGFEPKPGSQPEEKDFYRSKCNQTPGIAVRCHGENPSDADNIGPLVYYSENGNNRECGSINPKRFPYSGKYDRQDEYQAPYVWVQFLKPQPNILINVLCRVYGQNIYFDKRTGRGLTRFQIYVEHLPVNQTSKAAEF